MSSVAIIDYGVCNLDSISRAIVECGGRPFITDRPSDLSEADRIILPGVGAFAVAMKNLQSRGMDTAICELLDRKPVPFLGICLGMQLMADSSTEGGHTVGLGLISADVLRLQPKESGDRIPHIGWNEVEYCQDNDPLFDGIPSKSDFYFVHSYHFCCGGENRVAQTPYCGGFASAVRKENIFGVQFHPEKSQRVGLRMLGNFLSL